MDPQLEKMYKSRFGKYKSKSSGEKTIQKGSTENKNRKIIQVKEATIIQLKNKIIIVLMQVSRQNAQSYNRALPHEKEKPLDYLLTLYLILYLNAFLYMVMFFVG